MSLVLHATTAAENRGALLGAAIALGIAAFMFLWERYR